MLLFLASVCTALFVSACCSLMEAVLLSLTPSQIGEITRDPATDRSDLAAIQVQHRSSDCGHSDSQYGGSYHWRGRGRLPVRRTIWRPMDLRFFAGLHLSHAAIHRDPAQDDWRALQPRCGPVDRPTHSRFMTRVMRPVVSLVHLLNKPFEGRRRPTPPHAVEEITALAGLARISNQISQHQERIIRSATRLSQLKAHEVMIPLEHVSFLSTSMSIREALIVAHLEAHTRFPVSEGEDPHRVIGYINFKELIYFMRTNPNDPNLRGIIRPLYYATPEESAANLLRVFVDQHIHMAIVAEADGKTLGLVTLEDLVEELVGEIEDEFDRLPRMSHPLSGGTWMMGGGVTVAALNTTAGIADS